MTRAEIKARQVDFGNQVRRVRHSLGISQRELARRSTYCYQWIAELELGKENPSLATMYRLAEALYCELPDLLQRD